jgi:zinc transport system permease protein
MEILIGYLSVGFFQRALVAGAVLGLLTGLLGALSIMRQSSFFGDAIAHSSLAGIAIGLWLGISPLFSAFVYAAGIAVLLPWIKTKLYFTYDNILGIILPFSMGLGILIFSMLPGYQPELLSFLFGSVLTISLGDLILLFVLAIIVVVVTTWKYYSLLLISLDQKYSQLVGVNTKKLELLYQLMLAMTIIAGVKLVGIVLINALLVIPASIAKLWSQSLTQFVWLSILTSIFVVLVGMLFSLILNAPPGSTIAVFSGLFLLLNVLLRKLLIK